MMDRRREESDSRRWNSHSIFAARITTRLSLAAVISLRSASSPSYTQSLWQSGSVILLWGPTGLCADHLSLIFVCNGAAGSQQITVLSPQGKSLFWLDEWQKVDQTKWMLMRVLTGLYKLSFIKKISRISGLFSIIPFQLRKNWPSLILYFFSVHAFILLHSTEYKSSILMQKTKRWSKYVSGNSSRY